MVILSKPSTCSFCSICATLADRATSVAVNHLKALKIKASAPILDLA